MTPESEYGKIRRRRGARDELITPSSRRKRRSTSRSGWAPTPFRPAGLASKDGGPRGPSVFLLYAWGGELTTPPDVNDGRLTLCVATPKRVFAHRRGAGVLSLHPSLLVSTRFCLVSGDHVPHRICARPLEFERYAKFRTHKIKRPRFQAIWIAGPAQSVSGNRYGYGVFLLKWLRARLH